MKPQGTLVDCVYCNLVHPEFNGTGKCPHCHGQTPFFKPMQMMDKYTSEQSIFNRIFEMNHPYAEEKEKSLMDFIGLLTEVDVYNFDFKSALISLIREMESGI